MKGSFHCGTGNSPAPCLAGHVTGSSCAAEEIIEVWLKNHMPQVTRKHLGLLWFEFSLYVRGTFLVSHFLMPDAGVLVRR